MIQKAGPIEYCAMIMTISPSERAQVSGRRETLARCASPLPPSHRPQQQTAACDRRRLFDILT